jgi:hypothetical protein
VREGEDAVHYGVCRSLLHWICTSPVVASGRSYRPMHMLVIRVGTEEDEGG